MEYKLLDIKTIEADEPEIIVTGDALRIEQVIINLLTNAIRYLPGRDRIDITISTKPFSEYCGKRSRYRSRRKI